LIIGICSKPRRASPIGRAPGGYLELVNFRRSCGYFYCRRCERGSGQLEPPRTRPADLDVESGYGAEQGRRADENDRMHARAVRRRAPPLTPNSKTGLNIDQRGARAPAALTPSSPTAAGCCKSAERLGTSPYLLAWRRAGRRSQPEQTGTAKKTAAVAATAPRHGGDGDSR